MTAHARFSRSMPRSALAWATRSRSWTGRSSVTELLILNRQDAKGLVRVGRNRQSRIAPNGDTYGGIRCRYSALRTPVLRLRQANGGSARSSALQALLEFGGVDGKRQGFVDGETPRDPGELMRVVFFVEDNHFRFRHSLQHREQRFETAAAVTKVRLEIKLGNDN